MRKTGLGLFSSAIPTGKESDDTQMKNCPLCCLRGKQETVIDVCNYQVKVVSKSSMG